MTSPQTASPTPQTVRILHKAMIAGVVLFAIVAHVVILPNSQSEGGLQDIAPIFLGLAVALCALGLFLASRIPRVTSGESVNDFWKRAARPALIAWAPLEAAGLGSIVFHSQTGSVAAIAVAAVAILIFAFLNPGYLERR